ncbi:YbjQ family protein [Phytohabitans houttuyneae]|uniref:UPF0145 protein n=1 Tax=Phytohabitans houttuyneae TaxID=1076126 RepID=A0A6V8KDH9_9ACTN|nr:UPF0145 protein [Phytohabitans houttuyneae]
MLIAGMSASGKSYFLVVLVVTTDDLPGYHVHAVLGEVIVSLARTRNAFAEGVKSLRGGAYDPRAPQHLLRWRTEAVAELGRAARKRGANAVLGMRFDHRDTGTLWVEMCAYGTAVVVTKAVA